MSGAVIIPLFATWSWGKRKSIVKKKKVKVSKKPKKKVYGKGTQKFVLKKSKWKLQKTSKGSLLVHYATYINNKYYHIFVYKQDYNARAWGYKKKSHWVCSLETDKRNKPLIEKNFKTKGEASRYAKKLMGRKNIIR